MSLAAIVAVMMSCGKKDDPAADEGGSGGGSSTPATPTRIAFAESLREFNIAEGQEFQMKWTVSPANVDPKSYTLKWSSSDESVITVDKNGLIKGIAQGTATIKVKINEYPDIKPATADVTVLEPAKVGDFIYSDGSWGTKTVVEGKEIIALVYWNGDPTLYDPILEEQFPHCTHGLALSLKQGLVGQWQKDFDLYYLGATSLDDFEKIATSAFCLGAGTMTEWLINHSAYGDVALPYVNMPEMMIGNKYLGFGGYTMTAAMEEFMQKDSRAQEFPLEIYTNTMKLVEGVATPATTTRWYIPGIYETALMVNTALQKPADFDNSATDESGKIPLVPHNNKNVAYLNSILSKITGADELPTDDDAALASCSDVYLPFDEITAGLGLDCYDYWMYFIITKVDNEATPEEKAAQDKRWEDWLKENLPDKAEEYKKYTTHQERAEIYIDAKSTAKKKPEWSTVDLSTLLVGITIYASETYANVSVKTGKSHEEGVLNSNPYSGRKGHDNVKDYVRAVIAF